MLSRNVAAKLHSVDFIICGFYRNYSVCALKCGGDCVVVLDVRKVVASDVSLGYAIHYDICYSVAVIRCYDEFLGVAIVDGCRTWAYASACTDSYSYAVCV